MSKINDGGPAFAYGNHEQGGAEGMSLRDWFAGQALAGMFRHDGWIATTDGSQSEVAFRAYNIADAMIAARGQP